MTELSPLKIDSPCIKVCVVDPETDLCIGCGRTRGEIAGWLAMAPDARQAVMEELPERLQSLTLRRRRKGGARVRRLERGRQ